MIPDRPAVTRRRRARSRAPAAGVGMADPGTRGRGVRTGVRRLRRGAARLRGLELHDRAAPGAARGRGQCRRRSDHRQPLVHRHGERDPLLRRRAGLRRRPPGHLQHRPDAHRSGDLVTDARRAGGPSAGDAVRARRDRRDRPPPRPAGHRGRRVRRRQRDPLERRMGAHRPPARRRRLLLVPSAQGDDHRRRRDADDLAPGVGSPVPDVAPALDVGAGHDAARVAARRLRGIQRDRIQLPADRSAGGDRPRAAAAAARDGGAPARAGPPLPRAAGGHSRPAAAGRAGVGAQQLAELLRPASRRMRPGAGHADRCSTRASRPGAAS